MSCIRATDEEEQKKMLTPSIRNEIVRDLVTQMYTVKPKPDRAFCTLVAKSLMQKYTFMKDTGPNVCGYVSYTLCESRHAYSMHLYMKKRGLLIPCNSVFALVITGILGKEVN